MDIKEFKTEFNQIAIKNGFQNIFGAWFKESEECILALILRKSNFSQLYYLIIKVNFKSAFGKTFVQNKEWVKHDVADILLGPDKQYIDLFNLGNPLDDSERLNQLNELFSKNIIPLTEKALHRNGLIELYRKGGIFLLPAAKAELEVQAHSLEKTLSFQPEKLPYKTVLLSAEKPRTLYRNFEKHFQTF